MSVRVLSPGWLTSVQDTGRSGHAAIGVGLSGAMDDVALRLANALAGNAEGAAALEITLRGPRLRFEADTLIALTGAVIDARCATKALPAASSNWVTCGAVRARTWPLPEGSTWRVCWAAAAPTSMRH
jgi:antagonist of KipI